jgi:hypothetical protein
MVVNQALQRDDVSAVWAALNGEEITSLSDLLMTPVESLPELTYEASDKQFHKISKRDARDL